MNGIALKRNPALDILRIFAALTVVLTHCSSTFVVKYAVFSPEFVWGNIFDSISRIGVPLFLMISGALFLDENREITVKGIFSKNIKNLAIITLAWSIIFSVLYNILFPLLGGKAINASDVIQGIIFGHFHMWYLYVIMGLYLITPFLKKFVCKENKNLVLIFIAVSFVATFLKTVVNMLCALGIDLADVSKFIDKFKLDFFNGYVAYFLLGWYIVHVGISRKYLKAVIYALGAISLAAIIFYVHFTGDGNAYENLGAPVMLYSAGVFAFVNNLKLNTKEKTVKALANLSKLTFGVYMVHVIVLNLFTKFFVYGQNPALYVILQFAVAVISSFFISFIISKIPFLRKLIKA